MQTQSTDIRLSVALVTRNRPTWLRLCLESWRAQSIQPFEIVVSDDSDSEYTAEIRNIAQRFSCRYVSGPRRGLYANRNNAALASQGTHIMSADDDHTHPEDFTKAVVQTVTQDPSRVWVFTERHPNSPASPLVCPAELAPHGGGKPPSNPSNCQAIACGSTVFPRRIFEVGLRYEEAYPMGAIWYLWGVVIANAGFRISYSGSTFVWHHAADSDSERTRDRAFTRSYLECMTFVSFVNALAFNPLLLPLAFAYGMKRVITPHSICGTTAPSRLGLGELWRAWMRALRAAQSTTRMLQAVNAQSASTA